MLSHWKKVAVICVMLSCFSLIAEGKPIEGKISIPIPFVSDQLFDYDIKKNHAPPSPDSNPGIETINREARAEYHLNYPTWKEFFSCK